MENTIVILGNGFDQDLGLNLSFSAYCHYKLCPACVPKCCRKTRWGDFENYLRKKILVCRKSKNMKKAQTINQEWIAFKSAFSFFFTDVTSKAEIEIDDYSFAYSMLRKFSDKSIVYTFNYTNPYEYLNLKNRKQFIYVHGSYYHDTFDKELMVISQSSNMIVGIDYKRIPQNVYDNKFLSPIIKQLNPVFRRTDIEEKLREARIVIFFGFSMSITDSDYFDNFFIAAMNGISMCKTIYYITYDKKGFKRFRKNIKKMGYDYTLIRSHIRIVPIYTISKDFENEDFKHVLSLI